MQVNKRTAAGRNGVAAGSVWESRMKIDQGKGGIKVFNGRENPQEEEEEEDDDKGTGLKSIRTMGRNRRTWKSGVEGDPVQLKKSRSELLKKLAVDFNKDKIFKVRFRKTALSNGIYDEDEDEENVEDEEEKEMEKEIEKIDIKEMNSAEEKQRTIEEKDKIHQIHEIPISVSSPWAEEKIHEQPISTFKQRSVTNKEKLQKIQAKLRKIHESPTSPFKQWNDADREKANQIHEIPESPFRHRSDEEKEKLHPVHEIPISQIKKRSVGEKDKIQQIHDIPEYFEKQRSLAEKQKLYRFHEIPTSPDEEKKSPLSTDHPSVDPDLRKPPPIAVAVAETFESTHETHNRLQSIVGLVMWRDIPKSAFAFGLGAFILLSSSLTKDLNFSLVSSISYLGLFYLAAIFLYRSIICRGAVDFEEGSQNYIVGEEEAIWVLKLILPYFNELLINMRGLFAGDPATTMKLATLLFVLARCGNSITIWTMTRLAFFGVFTLPKFFSAYSTQITGYGKFWVRRLRDAWDSCTHKKVVAATMFTFIWNSSSITARIWAVFMLIVAVRFYQQSSLSPSMINQEEWCEEEAQQDSKGGQCMEQKGGGSSQANVEKEKEKKRS